MRIKNCKKMLKYLSNFLKFSFIAFFFNILAFLPYFCLYLYLYCPFDYLTSINIAYININELIKNSILITLNYLIYSENIQDIISDILLFIFSILQLIFFMLYPSADMTLKSSYHDTTHFLDNIDKEQVKAMNIMFKKGEGEAAEGEGKGQDKFKSNRLENYESHNEDLKPLDKTINKDSETENLDKPKVDKGKYRATEINSEVPFTQEDKKDFDKTRNILDQEAKFKQEKADYLYASQLLEEEAKSESEYSLSEYSIIGTNSVNSEDDEETVKEKLQLQKLDQELRQQKLDRDLAEKIQNEWNSEQPLENHNVAASSKTGQASSSKATESSWPYAEGSTSKGSEDKKHNLDDSDLENERIKKWKKENK